MSPALLRAAALHPNLIARLAVRSLHAELVLYPKPGLVSPVDSGSHDDMDATTFMRSLFALRSYFQKIAAAGAARAEFDVLAALGMAAERRMLAATAGVNTHRGAIFCLGMVCAAAGRAAPPDGASQRTAPHPSCGESGRQCNVPAAVTPATIRVALASWGDALQAHCRDRRQAAHGTGALLVHGAGGARAEVAAGLPAVFEIALPAIEHALNAGRDHRQARIDAFFALMAHTQDTNVYHRGGAAGARLVRETGAAFIARGGTGAPDWHMRAVHAHRVLVSQALSPGGAADLLAAAILVRMLTTPGESEVMALTAPVTCGADDNPLAHC